MKKNKKQKNKKQKQSRKKCAFCEKCAFQSFFSPILGMFYETALLKK